MRDTTQMTGGDALRRGRTITAFDLVIADGLTAFPSAMHLDEAFGAQTMFGGRVANWFLGTYLAAGLLHQNRVSDYSLAPGTTINLRCTNPLRIDNSVRLRNATGETGVSQRFELLTEDGTVVQHLEMRRADGSLVEPVVDGSDAAWSGTSGRFLGDSDVSLYCAVSGEVPDLFIDPLAWEHAGLAGRPLPPILGLGCANGLVNRMGVAEGEAMGFLGLEDWTCYRLASTPCRLRCAVRTLELRPSKSTRDRAVLQRQVVVFAEDVVIQSGVFVSLVRPLAG